MMKFFFTNKIIALLVITHLSTANALKKCKFTTDDIGVIIGEGSDQDKAFAEAVEKCFDSRMKVFNQRNMASFDKLNHELNGMDIIDRCVNLICE